MSNTLDVKNVMLTNLLGWRYLLLESRQEIDFQTQDNYCSIYNCTREIIILYRHANQQYIQCHSLDCSSRV
jgi:hypothetical protein